MKIRALLFICCTSFMVSAVSAQKQTGTDTPKETIHIVKMDKRVSELMADRVTIRKDMGLKELAEINARVDESLAANEALLFPADELYGSNWDTRWVDPFRGGAKVEMPDSCAIDCSTFILPIDTMTRVTSKYGPRRRRMHKGIDLKVQVGDTIRAAFDGKVRIRNFERRGYGNYLVVRHPNGLETVYGHLSKSLVDVNDIVRAGDPIALGGNTGRSTGSHLHFETRFLGQAINPADIIDFENSVPHQDVYVFHNIKINGRKSNIYTSSSDQMVYHRVKSGDTLGKIARMYGTTQFQNSSLGYTIHFAQLANCCSVFSSQSTQGITTLNAVVNRCCFLISTDISSQRGNRSGSFYSCSLNRFRYSLRICLLGCRFSCYSRFFSGTTTD